MNRQARYVGAIGAATNRRVADWVSYRSLSHEDAAKACAKDAGFQVDGLYDFETRDDDKPDVFFPVTIEVKRQYNAILWRRDSDSEVEV